MSTPDGPPSVLDVRPVELDSDEYPGNVAYVNLLVNGRVLLDEHEADWFGSTATEWTSPLRPTPLHAVEERRRVYLSGALCDIACCGGISVALRRDGDVVVWSDWLNTYEDGGSVPGEIRFDATQYDAARARMESDHSWERPAETVARLLEETYCAEGFYGHRDATLVGAWTSRDLPDRVRLLYRSSERRAGSYSGAVVLPVDPSRPPVEEARRLAERLRAENPRKLARAQARKEHWEL